MKQRLAQVGLSLFALALGGMLGSMLGAAPPSVKKFTLRESLTLIHAHRPVNVIFRDMDDRKVAWDATMTAESQTLSDVARHYGYQVTKVRSVAILSKELPKNVPDDQRLQSVVDWLATQLPGAGDREGAARSLRGYANAYQAQAKSFANQLPVGSSPLSSLAPEQQARVHQLLRQNKMERHARFLADLVQVSP